MVVGTRLYAVVSSFDCWHLRLQYILNTEGFQTFLQCSCGKTAGKSFGIIISNPPQLPSATNNRVSDFGGYKGLDVIKKIVHGFSDYVNNKGELYMLIFDFLLEDLDKLCNNENLSYNIVSYYNKKVRKGGETEQKIKFIEKIYTKYKFKKINSTYYHKVYILKIEKNENYSKSSRGNI